jgi:flagellar M-ring protein FliF
MNAAIQLFKEMGPAKSLGIGAAILAIIIGIFFVSTRLSSSNFVPLYNNLDLEDSNKIVSILESRNIAYQLSNNGSQILVPDDKVLRLRMEMAQEGVPARGSLVGYEIFDKSETLGTSNFVQNVNLVRALEGELSRTIGSFAQVEKARVHLVMPKRELFSREKQSPTASVVIKMRGKRVLSKEEINAISHLVATAVPGLDISKITIVDTVGRSLKVGSSNSDDPGLIAATAEDFRVSYENRLKRTIEELLEKSLGAGRVKAQINAEMNFDRTVTNSEIYDPAGQVVRSIQAIEEKESSSDKDVNDNVSVGNNLPNANKGGGGGNLSSNNAQRTDETTNYEISKTIKNHVSETGTVKRLSIAVLIDGTYKTDPEKNEIKYIPRSEEELKKIEALVKSSVGFDPARNDKIEIVNMQFLTDLESLKEDTVTVWLKRELPNILQTLVIGIVVILVLLLVVRPIAIRAFEITKNDLDEAESIESITKDYVDVKAPTLAQDGTQEAMIDIERLEARFKTSSNKSVNEVVKNHPEETLSALRNWLQKN